MTGAEGLYFPSDGVQLLPEDLRAIVIALRNILDATHEDDIVNLNPVDIARQLERAMRRQYGEG